MAGKLDDFDPNNPYTAIALLSERVKNLGIEKEAIERDLDDERKERKAVETDLAKRIASLEASYGKGAGILIGLGMVGTLAGILFAWGKTIFAPWIGK